MPSSHASTPTPRATFDATILANVRTCDTTDVPEVSGVERRKSRVESHDFHLGKEIERAIDHFVRCAETKGIELASFVDHGVPAELRGDVQGLRQVVGNLVAHAVELTQHGGVLVRARLVQETSRDVVVRINVWYTGQADASSPTLRRTGLGFESSRRLVELMGGEIGENDEGGGSVVWFTARLQQQPVGV